MVYSFPRLDETLFPGAAEYRTLINPNVVQEGRGRYFPYSERHLQALWFDDSLRSDNLKTVQGEPVVVESPGRWNLEAGPDFRDAVLLVGRERRRIVGDAEVHVFSNDWKNHGHASDRRYEQVRFHICWFSDPVDASLFPPGTVHLSLNNRSITNLERIDLTAYPYAEPRACTEFPMLGTNPDEIVQTLEDAGMERLRQKAQRMGWLMQQRGDAQALYEETAAALGYKNNKGSCRTLAQTVPLSALARYGADWETVYAVFLGISGLLPRQAGAKWSAESKEYFRSLWDCWWREEHRWDDVERLSCADWNFSGLRPLNHPIRRLCALAQWSACGCFDDSGSLVPFRFHESFWSTHAGWGGRAKRTDLVGTGRRQAIMLNVTVPFGLAEGDGSVLENLPAEPMNSVIKETAYALFGPDHSAKLYRTALARQGVIQLFHDVILPARA